MNTDRRNTIAIMVSIRRAVERLDHTDKITPLNELIKDATEILDRVQSRVNAEGL